MPLRWRSPSENVSPSVSLSHFPSKKDASDFLSALSLNIKRQPSRLQWFFALSFAFFPNKNSRPAFVFLLSHSMKKKAAHPRCFFDLPFQKPTCPPLAFGQIFFLCKMNRPSALSGKRQPPRHSLRQKTAAPPLILLFLSPIRKPPPCLRLFFSPSHQKATAPFLLSLFLPPHQKGSVAPWFLFYFFESFWVKGLAPNFPAEHSGFQ